MERSCYICERTEVLIDDHHIDCAHGARSKETVPLCRRCHRTYHDHGVDWFEDEFLDRVLEIENKRRAIYGIPPMKREDVKRSPYWNKTHGIREEGGKQQGEDDDIRERFMKRQIIPLCGWDWVRGYRLRTYPEQYIEVSVDDKVIAKVAASEKSGTLRKAMKDCRSDD